MRPEVCRSQRSDSFHDATAAAAVHSQLTTTEVPVKWFLTGTEQMEVSPDTASELHSPRVNPSFPLPWEAEPHKAGFASCALEHLGQRATLALAVLPSR